MIRPIGNKIYACVIGVAVLCGTFTACTKESALSAGQTDETSESQQIQIPEGYTLLKVSASTKTEMNDLQVRFCNGDKVMVNGVVCPVILSGSNAYVAAQTAASYDAFYPAEIVNADGPLVSGVQYYATDSFGPMANPMYASTTGNTLNFQHLFGILCLTVKGNAEIASINVKDNALGAVVCGQYTRSAGTLAPKSGAVAFPDVTLNCVDKATRDGVKLGSEGTDFHIVLPARTYASGLTLTLSAADGRSMVINSSTSRTIAKGEVLTTPVIDFQPDANQIFSYSFDSFCYGSDPVGGKKGFAASAEANPALEGYETTNLVTASSATPGSAIISNDYTNIGPANFAFPQSYVVSRNLQDFNMMFRVREYRGYLGLGAASGDYRAIFRTPKFTNIPANTLADVEVRFKMAFVPGAAEGVMMYPHSTGSGYITAFSIDGVPQTINKEDANQWCRGNNTPGLAATNLCEERLLIKPFADNNWHDVSITVSAASATTWFEMASISTKSIATGYYIDNLEAYITSNYSVAPQKGMLTPGVLANFANTASNNRLNGQGTVLGYEYIDLWLDSDYLYITLEGNYSKWVDAFKQQKDALDASGLKAWGVHLPYSDWEGSGVTGAFELCSSSSANRNAAIKRLKDVMSALAEAGLTIKYYVGHPTMNPAMQYSERKNYLEDACRQLVSHAGTLGGVFCIENLKATSVDHLCGKAEYLNTFCENVPGLGICFDVTHAIVGGRSTADAFAKELGSNIKTVHIHDGDTVEDVHLYPGYKGSYKKSGTVNWAALYSALYNDCGYRGPMIYEISTYATDCILNYSRIADNYYNVVYGVTKN